MVTKAPNLRLSFCKLDINDRMDNVPQMVWFALIWFSFIEYVSERKAELDICVVNTLYAALHCLLLRMPFYLCTKIHAS